MKPVRLDEHAKAELREAVLVYDQQLSGRGQRFLDAVDEALTEISQRTQGFARLGKSIYRECILTRFPYILYFRELEDVIEVAAISHGRRKPGYWIPRTNRSE